MDLNKSILWVFSHPNPSSIPSYVVSGILPADYLFHTNLVDSALDVP